jgi:hypothetical protein
VPDEKQPVLIAFMPRILNGERDLKSWRYVKRGTAPGKGCDDTHIPRYRSLRGPLTRP